jgi:hypothetical protein
MARDAKTFSSAERAVLYGVHRNSTHARSETRARKIIEAYLPELAVTGPSQDPIAGIMPNALRLDLESIVFR